jgi:hypothetical protein
MRVLLFRAADITILLLVAPVWATVVFASDAEVGGLSATQEVRDLPVAGLTERILYLAPPAARASDDAPRIAASMTHSPDVQVLFVSGGILKSSDCGSLSPHGYYGIETNVVSAISSWCHAHSR